MQSVNMSQSQSGGISALGLVGAAFVIGKVFEIAPIAGWSWWWVTTPFWIPLAIVLGVLGVTLLIVGTVSLSK